MKQKLNFFLTTMTAVVLAMLIASPLNISSKSLIPQAFAAASADDFEYMTIFDRILGIMRRII